MWFIWRSVRTAGFGRKRTVAITPQRPTIPCCLKKSDNYAGLCRSIFSCQRRISSPSLSGKVSNLATSCGMENHGNLLLTNTCAIGSNPPWSSSVPGRRIARAGLSNGSAHRRVSQFGQSLLRLWPPLPRSKTCSTGSPSRICRSDLPTHITGSAAPPVRRWQTVQ